MDDLRIWEGLNIREAHYFVNFISGKVNTMKTAEIRAELHEFIDKADERVLKLIYGLITADKEESEDYYMLTDSIREALDERLKVHESNPNEGFSWDETKVKIKKKE